MTGRDRHIPVEQLTALAFVVRAPIDTAPATAEDQAALAHVSRCDACAAVFTESIAEADGLREVAIEAADAVFDSGMLDAQRTRILDRLANMGQAARILSFPRRPRKAALPVSSSPRRWVSAAAAAGLIIGLVAGQMLHFVPARPMAVQDQGFSMQAVERQTSGIIPASAMMPMLSDDELMEEVEAAMARRAHSLRALDALTPTADLLAMGR